MLDKLRFEVATRKHAEDIEKFLADQFGKTEPIGVSLKLTNDDTVDLFHKAAVAGYSHEKYSTVIYDGDRLVGICLCSISKPGTADTAIPPDIDAERHDFAEDIAKGPYKQHKANQINAYVSTLEHRQKRLLGSNAKVFKLDILCVHREYMGRGLGKQLTERAIQTAQAEGCDWVATAATACASQGIFTKRGFQVFYEIPYSVFRENGNVVFQNLHDSCQGGKFMALRLSS
ncbi:hypothetical protein Aduo_014802 [Ancylostoma duodenale]